MESKVLLTCFTCAPAEGQGHQELHVEKNPVIETAKDGFWSGLAGAVSHIRVKDIV